MEKAVFSLNRRTPLGAILACPEPFPYDRVYFGTEMCERLVLKTPELLDHLRAAQSKGVKVTLMTPCHLTDAGLEALDKQLQAAASVGIVDEVVFNDWGALEIICEHGSPKPVLGRGLHRLKRDPRLDLSELRRNQLHVLRSSHITIPVWRDYLRSRGVERVECDNVPQGLDIDFQGMALHASLYFPFIPVSFSRSCVQGAAHRSGRDRYQRDGKCQLECRNYYFQLDDPAVLMIGKATYMVNESLDRVRINQFDRLVRVVP